MRIRSHRLQHDDGSPVSFVPTKKMGGKVDGRYLVMHYTAGASLQSSVDTLTTGSVQASAHVAIGRDGTVVQIVPFDRVAWHAGVSRWHDLNGLNGYSIGIELDNAGRLERRGDGWATWFGRAVADDDVLVAAHPHGGDTVGWQRYSEDQLTAAIAVARAIVDKYGLRDVLGHEDIAPGRKTDPGPAFPMASFRSAVMGRANDAPEDYVTTARLNIRDGPGTEHARLDASPLTLGARLRLVERRGVWCAVEVLDGGGRPQHTGWVHGNYIAPA